MSNPKQFTFAGRLSFPSFTAQEAFDLSKKGNYPATDVASTASHFQLLLNQQQWDKFKDHVLNVFLPYCEQQHKKGEKKDALAPKEVKALAEEVEALGQGMLNTPIKSIHEKTKALAPEAVVAIKVIGPKGANIDLRAIVRDESELTIPDPDILSYPLIKPIGQTTHQMYPGCNVSTTGNLYAFHNGKLPGFSCGGTAAVFRFDDERFGGSTGVDEDAVFMID
jgi:hypothetical protein